MTTVPVTPVPVTRRQQGHYGFAGVARMEWAKLRSVRSTGWLLGLTTAAVIGLAILVMAIDTSHWSHLPAAARRRSTRPITASRAWPLASSCWPPWARS